MTFDYQSQVWGSDQVRLAPTCLEAFKLRRCLADLGKVQDRVLEVGCGAGGMSKAIRFYRPDLKIIALDVSQAAITHAQKDSQGVKFLVATANELPFKKDSFSAVVLFDVLEHLPDPPLVLTEVSRILKPGGLLHLFVPLEAQPGTFYWLLKNLGWPGKTLAGHLHRFDCRQLQSLAAKTNYQVVNWQYAHHWLYQLIDLVHYWAWTKIDQRPIKKKSLSWLKQLLAPFTNLETTILSRVPGGGVSLTLINRS